ACLDQWTTAGELLREGTLAVFLAGLGRADLAAAARQAGRFPDVDRGLDDWLRRLPAPSLRPARLRVESEHIDLGRLRPGQDTEGSLRIVNDGMGLLHGSVSTSVPWLGLGEGGSSLFQCREETTLRVVVRGKALRATAQPLAGQLLVESSGGQAVVNLTA